MRQVCIAGYGAIAPVHAGVLEQLPGVRLAAVCDPDPAAVARCLDRYAVKTYRDFDAMLRDPAIDTVHICTPHHLHFPMIRGALDAGKSVVVEKPVTRTAEEFAQLLALPDSDKVCVVLQNRYNPCIQRLKALLQAGELGDILGIQGYMTWHKDPQYYRQAPWKGKWATEGGSCLINQALHTLDLMVYLGGPVETLRGSIHNHSLQGIIETEDTVQAQLQFSCGARGLFYATNAYCVNAPVELVVTGSKATARCLGQRLYVDGQLVADDSTVAPGQDYWGGGHYFLLKDYYAQGRFFSPAHIAPTMDALFGIYRSENRPVKL